MRETERGLWQPHKASAALTLIGDVGATNARFGFLDGSGKIDRIRVLACRDYAGFAETVEAFLEGKRFASTEALGSPINPIAAAIAVAAHVRNDQVAFVNRSWSFSQVALKSRLGLDALLIVNDFSALAAGVPHLAISDLQWIGRESAPDKHVPNAIIGVLGPGTGLGVGGILPIDGRWVVLPGEGGHVSLAPMTERESQVLDVMRRRFGHASAERALSGPGIVNLYNILAEIDGTTPKSYIPAEVTEIAIGGRDPHCREALDMFAEMLGTVAGDLALTLGATGGIYIGGGILPRLGPAFPTNRFRQRFEKKGRLCPYLTEIPSFVIQHPFPAFVGLAALLRSDSTIVARSDQLRPAKGIAVLSSD